MRLRKENDMSDHQLLERASGQSIIRNLTPITQVQMWKPRYYFFYGVLTKPDSITRSLGLTDPPVPECLGADTFDRHFDGADIFGYHTARERNDVATAPHRR